MRATVVPGLVLALTACGSGGTPAAAPTTPATTSPAASSPTPLVTGLPTPAPRPSATALPTDLADGKTYARLTTFDRTKHTVTVDVVQFLTGKAAEDAAEEDGEEAFDYYVRNQNPRLRTLTYRSGLPIVVNTLTAAKTGSSTKDTTITEAELAAYFTKGEAQQRLYFFTLTGGAVTALHEQYLP
jgi:hypothetical protein